MAPPLWVGDSCWRHTAGKPLSHRRVPPTGHPESAPPPASGGLSGGAICSPHPAKPCGTVPGSKIFTKIPRRFLLPLAFPAARFAPRTPQSLMPPSGPANRAPRIPPAGRLCWRCPAGKALCRRRTTPTGRPESAPPLAAGRPCWRCPAGKALCHRRVPPTGRPVCESREKDCRYLSPAKHSISIGSLKGFTNENKI